MGGVESVQGLSGTFTTTTSSIPDLGTRIEVNSDRGSIIWKDGKIESFYLKDGDISIIDSIALSSDRPTNIFEDMANAIRREEKPMVDGREELKSVVIFNAIYESSKTGKAVKIEEAYTT